MLVMTEMTDPFSMAMLLAVVHKVGVCCALWLVVPVERSS